MHSHCGRFQTRGEGGGAGCRCTGSSGWRGWWSHGICGYQYSAGPGLWRRVRARCRCRRLPRWRRTGGRAGDGRPGHRHGDAVFAHRGITGTGRDQVRIPGHATREHRGQQPPGWLAPTHDCQRLPGQPDAGEPGRPAHPRTAQRPCLYPNDGGFPMGHAGVRLAHAAQRRPVPGADADGGQCADDDSGGDGTRTPGAGHSALGPGRGLDR